MARPPRLHEALPVRTVARLTGLSPDLIRVWEKRYRVVAPQRGPRGARLYTAQDVRHLRLLGQVVATGRAIGDIAARTADELETLLGTAPTGLPATPSDAGLAPLLAALQLFDAAKVERWLGDALVAFGDRLFAHQVAAPLLTEIGNRWERGQLPIAAEHLVSGALRNLLGGLIHARGFLQRPTVLLATPSGEGHEMGLLLVALLLRGAGLGVFYLGPDLPAGEIVTAAQRTQVAAVGISVVDHGNLRRAAEEVRAVEAALPADVAMWVGGRAAVAVCGVIGRTRIQGLDSLDKVEMEISRLRHLSGGWH